MLCRLSYVRVKWHARLESNQRPLPSQGSALSTELRAFEEEPPAGFEPAPRPYDGRVLAADTTEAENRWRCRESNPILLGASEVLCRLSFIPEVMRTGGVEPPQREASALQAGELADAQRPLVKGWPAGFEPAPRGSRPRMLPLHHGHSGDGRIRTGGLSPDKRALRPSELRPP